VHRAFTIAGSIARIGPNDLLTSSPELLAHIAAVRTPYTRTAWYYRAARVEAGKDHIFSQVDENKHMKRRQQMAAGVSSSLISYHVTLLTPTKKIVLRKGEPGSRRIDRQVHQAASKPHSQ
jgi:hypothetical protein